MEHGDLYRQIIRSLTDGIVALDLDGRIRFANASAEALLRAVPLQGRDIGEFLDEQGAEDSRRHLETAAAGASSEHEVDSMFVREDGTAVWVRLKQTVLMDGDRAAGVILRLTDNHETKRLLDEISTSREELLRAEEIARLGSWTWDLVAQTTTYSDGLRTLYGDNTEALVGQSLTQVREVTHPEDHARLAQGVEDLRSGASPVIDIELRQRGRHGWIWVRMRARGTYDDAGELLSVSGTHQDITRARDTEDQLQDLVTQNSLMQAVATAANEAATLDEVLQQARAMVVLHDDWDRARAFVPTPDGATVVPHRLDDHLEPADEANTVIAARELALARECFAGGVTLWDTEDRLTIAFPLLLGEEVLAVLTITSLPPLFRHEMIQTMVEQAALQLSRVAERERAAAQLADARDRALEASRHKSEFLATMSHEIRTPLNGVVGLTELLGHTALDAHQQHLVSGIALSSRSLLEVINDVLDFSKIEAGHLELESVDLDVRELLEHVGSVLGGAARAKGLELRVSCSPGVPEMLAGDPVRLQQVLVNLGSNAVKFTSQGAVSIRATATSGPDGATLLRMEVRDTGIGIGEAQQRHIFAPFTQADTSTTRRFGGTGLGLAICAEIVRAFDGEIGVESEPGIGSVFWFTALLSPATGSREGSPLRALRKTLGRARVLVVDDSERTALREQLAWWHIDSRSVGGPDEAAAALEAAVEAGRPYDVVLLDLAAPDPDALAAAAHLRRAGHDPVPLVLLTSAYVPTPEALHEAGIVDYLTRPVPSSGLREMLLRFVAPDQTAAAPAVPDHEPGHGLVLVVEDNAVNRIVARGLLEGLGYAVELAEDGLEALEKLETRRHDLVLMDLQMPRLDGYATTRALRERETAAGDGRRLPVLAMTAAAVTGERERCLEAGMDDFITKPVAPATLAAALARWVPPSADDTTPGAGPGAEPDAVEDGHSEGDVATGAPTSPHLDLERLEMLRDLEQGSNGYLERALDRFESGGVETAARLRSALAAVDDAELAAAAHLLKGGALNLGLTTVGRLAAEVERLARDGGAEAVDEVHLDQIEAAVRQTREALEAYRRWYGGLDDDGDHREVS